MNIRERSPVDALASCFVTCVTPWRGSLNMEVYVSSQNKPTNQQVIRAAQQGWQKPNMSGNPYAVRQQQEKLWEQHKLKDKSNK